MHTSNIASFFTKKGDIFISIKEKIIRSLYYGLMPKIQKDFDLQYL